MAYAAHHRSFGRPSSDRTVSGELPLGVIDALPRSAGVELCAAEAGVSVGVDLACLSLRFVAAIDRRIEKAVSAMALLEAGAIANAAENRMVGHYWLRAPGLAPNASLEGEICAAVEDINRFASDVRTGRVRGQGGRFKHVVHIGIGGSVVGSQMLCTAVGERNGPLAVHFADSPDPDAIAALLARLQGELGQTLVSVVSKSAVTPTTLHVANAIAAGYARIGLQFAKHAVAITCAGSDLDRRAIEERWLARFPLWEWVGGRTSVTSAVGLLPAALLGAETSTFLRGAAEMDAHTRGTTLEGNPAALLAGTWYCLGEGSGKRAMVVVPYRERLRGIPRYVQQLVMESVGKRSDRSGNEVRQGLTVYGNVGPADQHAYFQQLHEGPDDNFVIFIHADEGPEGCTLDYEVAPGVDLSDYLFASFEGAKEAVRRSGRPCISIALSDMSEATIGALVALFERAVGIYAEMIDVNAYDQPSVDKFVAARYVELQARILKWLWGRPEPCTFDDLLQALGSEVDVDVVRRMVARLARRGYLLIEPSGSMFGVRRAERV